MRKDFQTLNVPYLGSQMADLLNNAAFNIYIWVLTHKQHCDAGFVSLNPRL